MPQAPLRQDTEHVSFSSPAEVREFPNGRAEVVSIGGEPAPR
jgi:hypothetical protein